MSFSKCSYTPNCASGVERGDAQHPAKARISYGQTGKEKNKTKKTLTADGLD